MFSSCFEKVHLPSSFLWGDNGSNFVGAARELQDVTKIRATNHLSRIFVRLEVPGRAPHFRGMWEAAVKSMKGHLRHTAIHNKLAFEEYSTILSQQSSTGTFTS